MSPHPFFIRILSPVLVAIAVVFSGSAKVFAAPANMDSELRRLEGFRAHQRAIEKMDEERESAAGGLEKKRQDWENSVNQGLDDYKRWKNRQAAAPEDGGPAWVADQKVKRAQERELEQAQESYIKERKKNSVELNRPFSEAVEYGLLDEGERVDPSKRAMFNSKMQSGSRPSGGSSSGGFSGDSSPPPPMDFGNSGAPPPPASGEPEFYEPEIPPPPPPPEGAFDDAIPPPVFDDPEF